jgi:hypothetical protein
MRRFRLVLTLCALGCGSPTRRGDGGAPPEEDLAKALADLAEPEPEDLARRGDMPVSDGTIIYLHDAKTLFTLDPFSFALTTVGAFGAAESMTDLAVTPDGAVYTISKSALYRVDTKSGKATRVVDVPTMSFNVALTFEPAGTLLASDKAGELRRIDPMTGKVTVIGNAGGGYNSAGDLVAVADGTMYGIADTGPSASTMNNVLLTVDVKTGRAKAIGPCGYGGVFGLAYSLGRVLGFTRNGEVIRIDPKTGKGTLVKTHPNEEFDGAGVTPLVPIG